MRILVIGAGPIGCLYAGRLGLAGHQVELVARGARLAALERDGLRLLDAAAGHEERPSIRVVAAGRADAAYDAVLVAVRADQLGAAFPAVAGLRAARCLVTLVNQPDGGEATAAALGAERLLLGFPGATGSIRADGAVVFSLVPGWAQPTTFGEATGGAVPRAAALARTCREAGFPSAVAADMPSWLRTHAAFIAPAGVALAFLAGGSLRTLAADIRVRTLVLDGVREGLLAVRASGLPLVPRRFDLLLHAPRRILLAALPRLLRSRLLAGWAGGHAAVSPEEMRLLLATTTSRARRVGLRCPATEELLRAIPAPGA
jgi:2-dehydropantoate 2-reductase